MKMLRYCFAFALSALAFSCADKQTIEVPLQNVRVETVASSGNLSVQYPGKVKAAQDISLAFKVSGTIDSYLVEEGSAVRKGQLLVQLDPTDYKVQMDATEAEYSQVKAEAERVMALYADSVATPNDYDRAVYGLQQITAKRQHDADLLSYTRLQAPFDGYVQKHLFDAHETIGAGTPVISMVGGGSPEVEINIPAAEYIDRAKIVSYRCTFNVYPGVVYDLSLISITPKANSNQLYTVRLKMSTAGKPSPSPGMNTMVTIEKSVDGNEATGKNLSISSGAVVNNADNTYVMVYEPSDSTVHRCDVVMTSVKSDGSCIVDSESLQPGDVIISSGARTLADGQKVSPLPPSSVTNVGGLL